MFVCASGGGPEAAGVWLLSLLTGRSGCVAGWQVAASDVVSGGHLHTHR